MPAASPKRRRNPVAANSTQNRLLQRLLAPDFAVLSPHLTRVDLSVGQIVSEPFVRPSYVHFPETAVLSLILMLDGGGGVEAATVGNEGIGGLSSALGRGAMNTRCLVQVAGRSQQISSVAFERAMGANRRLEGLLLDYAQAFINQLAQSVACNRLHTIDQRCARWLLMTHDRVGGGNTFDLTQEFLSYMLGVRREAVSRAANALQTRGTIRYARGHVEVLDRAGLERAACECYAATSTEFSRLAR